MLTEYDAIRGMYVKYLMRGLVVEEIAHHLITAVSAKNTPASTAPIIFGKENGVMAMGSPQSMISQIVGPVFRFISLFNHAGTRIHYGVALMTNPLRLLEVMAEFSPEDLKSICRSYYEHQECIQDCIAAAVLSYFSLTHTGFVHTAQSIVDQLGEAEAGTVLVDTYRIHRNAHKGFWQNADLAIQVRKQGIDECKKLLKAYQRRSADLCTDYDSWIAEVDLTNAHLVDQMLGPEKPVTLN